MPYNPSPAPFRAKTVILISSCILLLQAACVRQRSADWYRPKPCNQIASRIDFNDRIKTLNLLSDAFYYECYALVIKSGARAQSEFRYKKFSIVKETTNIFIPEGTFIDYVLESYERGYLTFLLSASYFKLGRADEARVELRRLDDEMKAGLYNYGEDPINIALQAVMWEKLGEPAEGRVDWLNLYDAKNQSKAITTFVRGRIEKIDSGRKLNSDWKIYAIDRFPEITWELKFLKSDSGYFRVMSKEPFLAGCSSLTGLRISAKSWMNKIAMRHDHGYHPLVNVRSWIRLPIGIAYGITTFSSGAAIIVGGCALDAAGKGNGGLCYVSLYGGAALIAESPKVLKHTLKPDFRHWENVPSSFLFTTADNPADEKCARNLPSHSRYHRIL
jgi:hypothetical protein